MTFFSIIAVFFSLTAFAQTNVSIDVTLSPSGSFQATTSNIKGQLKQTGDTIQGDKFSILIKTFKTGIELRDEHFAKHLNADSHPKAILTQFRGQNGKASATLEVNGVSLPIDIKYQTQEGMVKASFVVKPSDFKLSKAQYLGVGVNDLVTVNVALPLK
jgi:YceI-like domain